jgi:hypothetical protein
LSGVFIALLSLSPPQIERRRGGPPPPDAYYFFASRTMQPQVVGPFSA